MKNIIVFILTLSFFTVFVQQKEEQTKWQTKVSKSEVEIGGTVDLIFTADIINNWYLYSSDFDKDLGPVVATFTFTPDESYELVGDIKPIGAKSKKDDEIWMGTYTYFVKKAEFRQTVKILKENPAIKVKLNGQACNDSDGKCVPVIKQFTFTDIKVLKKSGKPAEEKPVDKGKPTGQIKNQKDSNASALNPAAFPSTLEYLKAEKAQLTGTKNDEVTSQLKDFVKKYGN